MSSFIGTNQYGNHFKIILGIFVPHQLNFTLFLQVFHRAFSSFSSRIQKYLLMMMMMTFFSYGIIIFLMWNSEVIYSEDVQSMHVASKRNFLTKRWGALTALFMFSYIDIWLSPSFFLCMLKPFTGWGALSFHAHLCIFIIILNSHSGFTSIRNQEDYQKQLLPSLIYCVPKQGWEYYWWTE